MHDPKKQQLSLTKSLMRGAYFITLKLLKIVLPSFIGIYIWIYLVPVMFPIFRPQEKPPTFEQVVRDIQKQHRDRERRAKELERQSKINCENALKGKPS